jgi:hypothetical protein
MEGAGGVTACGRRPLKQLLMHFPVPPGTMIGALALLLFGAREARELHRGQLTEDRQWGRNRVRCCRKSGSATFSINTSPSVKSSSTHDLSRPPLGERL